MLARPKDTDKFPSSEYNLKKFGSKEGVEHVLSGAIPKELALPAKQFGWDLSRKWRHVNCSVNSGKSTVSETAFNTQSHTLVSFVENNYPLKKILEKEDDKQLPYRSELWSNLYKTELKAEDGSLKYIMSSNVANEVTSPIINAIRSLLVPGKPDSQVIQIDRQSDDIAQRESFIALAGSVNGASMFRMLTDRHILFGNRHINRVWVWGARRGQCEEFPEFCYPTIVWEIMDGLNTGISRLNTGWWRPGD